MNAFFCNRTSWCPPSHGSFGPGKSLQKNHFGGGQCARDTPLRPRVLANPFTNDSGGYFGALTRTQETLPDKQRAQPSTGPGSSVLEKWMERYLTEIVRHLPEAPFLQFVPKYSSISGERQRFSEELFEKPESWTSVKECLLESAPDGIILVHRLDEEDLSECRMYGESFNEDLSTPVTSLQAGGSSTDVWGVLVHGCKTRCNACYILKTTRVASSGGILTHFCLSRAQCFGPSLRSQLQSTWLL